MPERLVSGLPFEPNPVGAYRDLATDQGLFADERRPALFPTPPERPCDTQGRPYFLWDSDMTLDALRAVLRDPELEVRAAYVGKLMRQAKPDDVFEFVRLDDVVALWPRVERSLGRERAMWQYLLGRWQEARGGDIATQ